MQVIAMYALRRDLPSPRSNRGSGTLAYGREQRRRSVEQPERWSVGQALLFAALLSLAQWAIFAALLYVARA
jgi:hypothetical protein